MASPSMHVKGLEATMRELRDFDPLLYKATVKTMREAMKPIVLDARASLPGAPPLSRWVAPKSGGIVDKRGRIRTSGGFPVYDAARAKRGVRALAASKRKKGFSGKYFVAGLSEADGAGIIYDAAKADGPDRSFSSNLSAATHKSKMRFMWPSVKKHKNTAASAVRAAAHDAEREMNARLRRRV